MKNEERKLRRIQVDISSEFDDYMMQYKRLKKHEKRYILTTALRMLIKTGALETEEASSKSYVRIQVDIPRDIADLLDEYKTREGLPKRYVVKKALEELFRHGKAVL